MSDNHDTHGESMEFAKSATSGSGDERFRDPRHPIQVVARRTGLSADSLRAWEKRYSTVSPRRVKGRRLYSDSDIERLALLKRATAAGRRISDVAHLSVDDLKALVKEDSTATMSRLSEQNDPGGRDARLRAATEAVLSLDLAALERMLNDARKQLSTTQLVEDFVSPLLRRVGELWRQGRIGIAHEHMTSASIRSLFGSPNFAGKADEATPLIVMTTPTNQRHELGALMASATAFSAGWRAMYLGPSMPADAIAETAKQHDARAVGLSVIYPDNDPLVGSELLRLRAALPARCTILLGGRAAPAYSDAVARSGAIVVASYPELVRELGRLRN
jgi:DNA-binding transcriptional MerR regulator/methylmalonyl-CoA mutase cobalamin-binding subunit